MRDSSDVWSGHPASSPPHPSPGSYPPPPEYYLTLPRAADQPPDPYAPPPEHAGAATGAYPPGYRGPGPQGYPQQGYPAGVGQAKSPSVARRVWRMILPILSAAISVYAFGLLFGSWTLGVGIVVLLFIHEMGHFIVIRAKGLPASLPIFIPLIGAYVTMRQMPLNVRDEAEIAIAGPIIGSLAGLSCLFLYFQNGDLNYLQLAYWGFLINLLNLLPISPLDGGRIVGAISRWLWPLGLVALLVAFYYLHSFFLLLLGVLFFTQTITRFRQSSAHNAYYQVSIPTRIYISVLYLGLAAGLGYGMLVVQHLMGRSPFGL